MSDPIDLITIIRSPGGKRRAKLIRADVTIANYDNTYRYDLIERPRAALDTLAELLQHLMGRPDCAVVSGAIVDPARSGNVRRLAHHDRKTGDGSTLRDVPHHLLALDMDGVDRPDDVPGATAAVQRLPSTFHGVRCIAQATASHGIKPGCRVRLWYWLSRPMTSLELTYRLRGKPADPSVFRTVQPIHTAAPVFENGVVDHLPQRMVMLPGAYLVQMPMPETLSPLSRPPAPLPKQSEAGANSHAWSALRNAASRIRNANVGQRHDTIFREARGLARFVSAGLLTECTIVAALVGAGIDAGKPEDEITSLIDWAKAHPSSAALPENVAL